MIESEPAANRWLDILLIAALLVFAGFVYWPSRDIAANSLAGDSPHYIYPTLNMVRGQGLVDIFNGRKYPPEHNFGLPLLMAGFYLVLGTHPGNGVYTVFLMGLGSVCLVYLIGSRLFNRTTGFIAGLFLIGTDAFRWYATHVMTDVPAAFFWLAAMWGTLTIQRDPKGRFWRWVVLGLVVGLGIAVRSENILVLVPVGAFILWERKRQPRWLLKAALLASGVALWLVVITITNRIYTGSWTRTPQQVTATWVYDRPDHGFDWRYAMGRSWREGHLVRYIRGALNQWNQVDTTDSWKTLYYDTLCLWAVFGLGTVIRQARHDNDARFFLMWLGLSAAALVGFFSMFIYFADRHMMRLVPFMCLLDGVTGAALISAMRRSNRTTKAALACVSIPFIAGYVYVVRHPTWYFSDYIPATAFLRHVSATLPSNSVVVTSINAWAVEGLVMSGSGRVFLPLNRSTSGADSYCAWHAPPHPEWIPDDATGPQRYPQMADNGAEEIYAQTLTENPKTIDGFLKSGRPVYFVSLGHYLPSDRETILDLDKHYETEVVEVGWNDRSYPMPATLMPKIWRQRPIVVHVLSIRRPR